MSAMSEIAPRLARAHAAECEYQQRKADVRRRGVLAMDVATEEMIRSMRLMGRAYAEQAKRIRGIASSANPPRAIF